MILPYNEAKSMFESFGLTINDEMYQKFDEYAKLLVSRNEKINLTDRKFTQHQTYFKVSKIMKNQEKSRNCHRLEEIR